MITPSAVLTGITLFALILLISALSLPAVKSLVGSWVRLYTRGLPNGLRERRRTEMNSDIYEHERAALSEGYKPREVAAQILVRFLAGIPADIKWSRSERKASAFNAKMRSAVSPMLSIYEQEDLIHARRTATYAMRIAKEMGIRQTDQVRLWWAAYLHDLGMALVPSNVRKKPSALTNDEYNTLKNHVVVGAGMVRRLDASTARILLHQNEYYNGSGHPSGLRGTAIPLLSRILIVARSFDAMTTPRPYRSAMSKRQALDTIQEQSSRMFDPSIVEATLQAMR